MSAITQKSVFRLAAAAAAVLAVQSFAALPRIDISTNGDVNTGTTSCSGQSMNGWCMGTTTTTYKYVKVSEFKLTDPNNGANNISRSGKPDSLKVRGNSTAGMVKKPYKIKFGEKVAVFGDTAAKSWVLLAEYFDATFALNGVAFALGKRLGLEFTNKSWLVEVYINNNFMGLYRLTEQVHSHKGRVDLKETKRGWLTEFDYHPAAADEKNIWFTSYFTFNNKRDSLAAFIKSPELDDTAFTKNPNDASQLNFVKNDINNLVNKMAENGFPNNGYRDLIDLESFAKYVLIQLFMDNFDFNSKAQPGYLPGSNYCYRVDSAKTTKIKAGPLWDFDLSAGVERTAPIGGGNIWGGGGAVSTFPQHYKNYNDSIAPTHAFYRRLWDDPVFKAKYYKLWVKHKKDFEAMGSFIDSIKNVAKSSAIKGDNQGNQWANNSQYGGTPAKLTESVFNTESNNLRTWWNNRLTFVDQKLKSYNIDTTKDIIDTPANNSPTSVASSAFGRAGGGLSLVKNGLRINAAGPASLKVFTLTGDVVRRRALPAGSHAVSLGDLPRGMYLVRVNLDGVKQTVKVAVR